jgi:hypothetical protein
VGWRLGCNKQSCSESGHSWTAMAMWVQVYGYQNIKSGSSSEQLLGKFLRERNQGGKGLPLVIATKFFTIPWTNFLVGEQFHTCIFAPEIKKFQVLFLRTQNLKKGLCIGHCSASSSLWVDIAYTQTSFMSLPGGTNVLLSHVCRMLLITCVHLGIYSQRIPRMCYYRR